MDLSKNSVPLHAEHAKQIGMSSRYSQWQRCVCVGVCVCVSQYSLWQRSAALWVCVSVSGSAVSDSAATRCVFVCVCVCVGVCVCMRVCVWTCLCVFNPIGHQHRVIM